MPEDPALDGFGSPGAIFGGEPPEALKSYVFSCKLKVTHFSAGADCAT
jgi:hypothetical protein